MEKTGAVNIFQRSIDKHNLRYTSFYGDGDSKSYSAVKDIYGSEKPASKYECIGHYQKRVGNRLRKIRKDKKLGGVKRLTNTKIDKLQNYFGIALRQNVGNLENMRKAILNSLFHVSDYHDNCLKTPDTWCQYQKDKIDGTTLYTSKGGLPIDVRQAIMPTYVNLTNPDDLVKCLHGKTQNANESFNGMIWERIPKIRYVTLEKLEFGVFDAIATFNIGRKASLDILGELNVQPGTYTKIMCQNINEKRKSSSQYKASSPIKKRRKVIRGQKKHMQDKNIEKEGVTYEAGGY